MFCFSLQVLNSQGQQGNNGTTDNSWTNNSCSSPLTNNQANQMSLFDFSTANENTPASDLWGGGALGLISQQHSLFGSLAQP